MLTNIYRPDGKISVLAGPISNPQLIAERPGLVHPRGQVMTLARLHQAIANRYGQGFCQNYCPWILVRRMTRGAVSNLNVFANSLYARPMHLLSGLEVSASAVALWPDAHLHPALDPASWFDTR